MVVAIVLQRYTSSRGNEQAGRWSSPSACCLSCNHLSMRSVLPVPVCNCAYILLLLLLQSHLVLEWMSWSSAAANMIVGLHTSAVRGKACPATITHTNISVTDPYYLDITTTTSPHDVSAATLISLDKRYVAAALYFIFLLLVICACVCVEEAAQY